MIAPWRPRGTPCTRRWRPRRSALRAVAAVTLGAALTTSGCSPGQTQQPLPPPVPTVEVRLAEYAIEYDRPIPPGRVVFRIHNAGDAVHRLALLPLPDDFPRVEEELANDTPRSVDPFARVPNLAPGETGVFAVDLVPGKRYAMVDYSKTSDGRMQAKLGVAAEFRTQEEVPSPSSTGPPKHEPTLRPRQPIHSDASARRNT